MKKYKIKNIIDFNIFVVRSILYSVVSYTLTKFVLFWFKCLSISRDPHKYLAGMMFNKCENSVTKKERTMAKYLLFRAIYGKSLVN